MRETRKTDMTKDEADCVIRIGDTCSKRGIQLGKAVVAKLVFNASRPYKHNKNS